MAMITFEATEDEKRVIEKLAKKDKMTVSQYVRCCVYMDLLFSGDLEALRVFSTRFRDKVLDHLRQPRYRKLISE